MVATSDAIYLGDSKGNMCAYNPVTGKYKAWKMEMATSKLYLFGDLLVVSGGTTVSKCIVMETAGFLDSDLKCPRTVSTYSAGVGC